jgi:hypothetical protein
MREYRTYKTEPQEPALGKVTHLHMKKKGSKAIMTYERTADERRATIGFVLQYFGHKNEVALSQASWVDPRTRSCIYGIRTTGSSASMQKKKKRKMQTKKVYLSKDPRYSLRSLTITMKDVFHVYNAHDGSYGCDKIANQLCPFRLPSVIWEPGHHLTEVLASAELQCSEGHTDPLPDSGHHHVLMVLHQEDLSEVGLFRLMAGDH